MSIFSPASPGQLPGNWAATALARLFGQDCVLCGAATRGALVCDACDADLPRPGAVCVRCALPLHGGGACGACRVHPPRFDAATVAFEYRFPLDRLVQRFKAAGDLALGAWLAQSLVRACQARPRPDVLVVPPLTPARLRGRGFNQAAELARVVSRELRVPLAMRALRRVRDTPAQKTLGARERRANLRDALRCGRRFDGLRVAIVDDVLTTGATASAIAELLREAGAACVEAWCVARTPAPGE